MPIFVSRFSPDRGLVGLMQSLRARGNTEEETTQGDVQRAEQAAQAAQESSSSRTDQSGAGAQAGEAQGQSAVDGRDGLSAVGNTGLALTLDISGTEEANRISNQQAAESTDQGDVGAVAQQLADQLENQEAGAEDADVAALATAEPTPATEEGGAAQVVEAQGTEQDGQAREGQVDPATEDPGKKAIPPAEVQRERVRSAAREIGSGLRRDAEIQNDINVEETSRNAARAVENSERQQARQSQEAARNLQAERRQLQAEVRRTEQQIRQLQGRASGSAAATKAANTLLTGSNINLLAQ
jgi:hypothetical protein